MEAPVRHFLKRLYMLALLASFGVTGCSDLGVTNPNAADASRVLQTPGDLETLVAGSFRTWWNGSQAAASGGPIMANQSFMFSSWPANFGMYFYSQLPSPAIVNSATHGFYSEMLGYNWHWNYRALAAVADGLSALGEVDNQGAVNMERLTAFARLVQGLAHGSLALLYDEAWIIDETTERVGADGAALPLETQPYQEVLEAALGYLDEAIALSTGASWSIPSSWMSRTVDAEELARVAASFKAQFRANVARTPEERAAVDWAALIADIDNGITSDFGMMIQFGGGQWLSTMASTFTNPSVGWAQVSYFMDGMADQSGMYQDWLSYPVSDRRPRFPDGSPRLIITPDQRFPQGTTLEEQLDNPGMPHAVTGSPHIIVGHRDWRQDARGTHRWSVYQRMVALSVREGGTTQTSYPIITLREMDLLRAEAAMHGGPTTLAEAADLINASRTAAGLSPTDAAGTNADCVPRLPDGSCGELFEMLKWEKRMEIAFFGLHSVPWWFDMRGWGDLYLGTPLHRPVPCEARTVIRALDPGAPECTTYGGVDGEFASPGSSYGFPHEGGE